MTHRCARIHDRLERTLTFYQHVKEGRGNREHPLMHCIKFPFYTTDTFDFSQCSSFFKTKTQARVTIYPNMDFSKRCTLMLAANLAEPEWVLVNCSKKLVSDLLCEVREQDNKSTFDTRGKILYCSPTCIASGGRCFFFLWYSRKSTHTSPISDLCKLNEMIRTNVGDVMLFHHIFDAVSASFPPILFLHETNYTHLHIIEYVRLLNKFAYQQDMVRMTDAAGFHMCSTSQRKITTGANLFQCRDNTFVSSKTVCDLGADCMNQTTFDMYCYRTNISQYKTSHIKAIQERRTCSQLQFLTSSGSCYTYYIEQRVKYIEKHIANKTFMCKSGTILNSIFQDDLVADCGGEAEDEPILLSLLKHHKEAPCKPPAEISCKEGHTKCYNTTDICSYKLDRWDQLAPCRNGGHLEQCDKFQCNMMFKCHKSFCLPWSYVCDGKWDCAFGDEEMPTEVCQHGGKCEFMYKCMNLTKCVHLGTICDDTLNCPFGDDELLCDLKNIGCPSECQCLSYAIRCSNMTIKGSTQFVSKHYPHVCVTMFQTTNLNIINFFLKFPAVMFATLAHNRIQDICSICQSCLVLHLDAGFNLVSFLVNNCFQYLWSLKTLNLTNNRISTLESKSFWNLTSLEVLCLSNNLFADLPELLFADTKTIKLLSMKNINSTNLDTNEFNDLETVKIDVTDFHLCCLLPKRGNCTSAVPWFISCTDLFPDANMKIICIVESVSTLVFNAVSILLQIATHDSTYAYLSTVISVNLTHMLVFLYLSVIWIADLHFSGTFILNEALWRSSTGCFVAFCFALWFTLLSQLVLLLLSISRMMVVVFPMDTRFKRTKFILRCVCGSTFASLLLSVSVTVFIKLSSANLSTPMCLPFFDPANKIFILSVLSWFIAISQIASAVAIIAFHLMLVYSLDKSQKQVRNSKSENRSNVFLIVQLFIITTSNILCWFPADVIYIVAMFVRKYPTDLVIWTTITTLPLNSVLNPLVFIATSTRKLCDQTKKQTQ